MENGLDICLQLAVPKGVIALSFFLLCASIVFLLLFVKSRETLSKAIVWTLLVEFLFLLFAETVIFRAPSETFYCRLTPFVSYELNTNGEPIIDYWEQTMNVLLFVPFGLLSAGLFKRGQWWAAVLLGFVLSCSVETSQYIFHRGFTEVDDVIHNTIGTAMGCGLYWGLRSIRNALQTKADVRAD